MPLTPVVQSSNQQVPAGATDALITAARSGCSRSLGELAERYRRYLLHVAADSLSPALRAKVGPSDLVQETLLQLHRGFARFEGRSEEELLTWLRRILYFRALQAARRYGGTAARDVRRELSLYEAGSSIRTAPLVDPAPTPRAQLLATEQIAQLEAALAALSQDAREIIELRSYQRMSFRDIGELVGCSPDAARLRWVRAVAQLRVPMSGHEG